MKRFLSERASLRARGAVAASLFAAVAAAACTADPPDLSSLSGVYVAGSGQLLVMHEGGTRGELRPDKRLPGSALASCTPPETCPPGLSCLPSPYVVNGTHACLCAGDVRAGDRNGSAASDPRCQSPVPTAMMAPLPVEVQLDALNRVQLVLSDGAWAVPGEMMCWSCSIEDGGNRIACESKHPNPGEALPTDCSFERLGSGAPGSGATMDGGRRVDADSSADAPEANATEPFVCGSSVCPPGLTCCAGPSERGCASSCPYPNLSLACTHGGHCPGTSECCLLREGLAGATSCVPQGSCEPGPLCRTHDDCEPGFQCIDVPPDQDLTLRMCVST